MDRNIKSKLSLKSFIFVIFPLVLLFCVLGIPKFISSIDEIISNNSNDVSGVILPILFLIFIIYIFFKLLNKFPKLTISENGIMIKSLFKNETYLWYEIENIELSGKKQFGTFFNTSIEAVTFELKNRNEKYFWIEQYSNSPEIRIILDRAKEILKNDNLNFKNLDFKIQTEIIKTETDITKQKEVFNNNYLFSANGILFCSFIIFTLFMIFQNPKTIIQNYDKLLLISLVSLVLCAIFSSTMNFFTLTEKHLIVKNSIWYWKNDVYKIENIKEIIIEMPFRSPITLKIITNNYENIIYKASSLNTSTWKKLILYLENKKVNVRNEVNFN